MKYRLTAVFKDSDVESLERYLESRDLALKSAGHLLSVDKCVVLTIEKVE